jgi:hypothetical protein
MRPVALASLFLGSLHLAAVAGCSASDNTLFQSGGSGALGTGATGTGATGMGGTGAKGTGATGTGATGMGGGISFDAGPVDDSGTPGCAAAAEIPYVFSQEGDIYSFDPPSKVFTKVATPGCSGSANSMAIDRNLVAWLNYIGNIYTYDLVKKNGCKPSGITLPPGFQQVGMGFSTDAVGGTAETLYLSSISGQGLGKVDMATKTVIPIGASTMGGELTGTGDARLFEYLTTNPVTVAQLDKSNGNTLSTSKLNGFSPPSDWAFTFWGGDFYLYAYPVPINNALGSSVVRYTPTTNMVDLSYVKDVGGFHIVGAGVSTCAPLTQPQ